MLLIERCVRNMVKNREDTGSEMSGISKLKNRRTRVPRD